MANGNGADRESPLRYYHAEGASGIGTGGNVNMPGVSERTVVALILLPLCIALAGSLGAAWYAGHAGGNAVATANAALALAQISERNAKLAQYQLEQAAARYKLEIPKEVPNE